jgi:DNA-binding transcriptional MerR regulator
MEDHNLKNSASLNMKAVARETGLKPDTLRAWERRYGLPQPIRTAGGHRLYSQRDVEILKWLITRQEEGLSISRAVELWKQLRADGEDPFRVMPLESSEITLYNATGATMDGLRKGWIEACKAFNEQQAEQILTRAFAIFPPEDVCVQILMKGLAQIGVGWYQGHVTVQQEHLASELAIRRLEVLIAATPPPTLPGKILLLCPPAEEHTFSPLLLTYLLRRGGRQALFLGANVPLGRIEHTIVTMKPDLVIMPAQQLHSAANLSRMADELQKLSVPVSFGGRIFNLLPKSRDRIHGSFLGEALEEAPRVIAKLIRQPYSPTQVQEPSDSYKSVSNSFESRLASIESEVWTGMSEAGVTSTQLTIANLNLTQNISAALVLGDIRFMYADMEWVKHLLKNLDIPQDLLKTYISIYAGAIAYQLGDEGLLISNYLTSLLDGELNQVDHP